MVLRAGMCQGSDIDHPKSNFLCPAPFCEARTEMGTGLKIEVAKLAEVSLAFVAAGGT